MSKFRVLLADPISPRGVAVFEEGGIEALAMPKGAAKGDLCARLREGFDAMVVRSATRADAEVLASGVPRLRAVGRAGVGIDNVDVEAATRLGVAVMNVPDGNTLSAAEHTMALLFAMARHLPQSFQSLREGKWERAAFTGAELHGKTLGLAGMGRIGSRVAAMARAVGMRVLVHDPYVSPEQAEKAGVTLCSLDELLAQADVLSLHVPLTDATRNLVNAERLAKMKNGARLVNCARGGLVDEKALFEALRSGHLAGAALDVFEQEPPPAGHPLLALPNFVATPHLGAATGEAQEAVGFQIAVKLKKFLETENFEDAINVPFRRVPEDWKPYTKLAQTLGAIHAQWAAGPVSALSLSFEGAGLDDVRPLTCACLKGLLDAVTEGGVNFVNAMQRARERGIEVKESTGVSPRSGYEGLLRVEIRMNGGTGHVLAGTILEKRHPRLVEVDGYHMDLEPAGILLLLENRDVPGVLGRTASTIGTHGLNIAECRLGRRAREEGRALAVFVLDSEADERTLAALRAIPEVIGVKQVRA
jgi:D-3-phosphoglycerate dehydrogenase